MLLVHRSNVEKIEMRSGRGNINSGAVLFMCATAFDTADEVDDAARVQLEAGSYCPGQSDSDFIHVMKIESWIDAGSLSLDMQSRAEIVEVIEDASDSDGDVFNEWRDEYVRIDPEDVLDGSVEWFVDADADRSWEIQRIRAEVARRAGYDAVVDRDEQGEVYIVDFSHGADHLDIICIGQAGAIRALADE